MSNVVLNQHLQLPFRTIITQGSDDHFLENKRSGSWKWSFLQEPDQQLITSPGLNKNSLGTVLWKRNIDQLETCTQEVLALVTFVSSTNLPHAYQDHQLRLRELIESYSRNADFFLISLFHTLNTRCVSIRWSSGDMSCFLTSSPPRSPRGDRQQLVSSAMVPPCPPGGPAALAAREEWTQYTTRAGASGPQLGHWHCSGFLQAPHPRLGHIHKWFYF